MGYLSPDFDYDLFISYAHADFDKAGSSSLKVWSQGFAAKLVSSQSTFQDVDLTLETTEASSDPARALRETRLTYLNNPNPELRDPRVWAPYALVE